MSSWESDSSSGDLTNVFVVLGGWVAGSASILCIKDTRESARAYVLRKIAKEPVRVGMKWEEDPPNQWICGMRTFFIEIRPLEH
jgi:hypothetical protein